PQGNPFPADPLAAGPQAHVRLRDRRDRPSRYRRGIHLARRVLVSEPPQDGGRGPYRRRVGGEGNRPQTPLLPHHEKRPNGPSGKGPVVDRLVRGREPHTGSFRWTSLNSTSIRSAAASADHARCDNTFGKSCASISATLPRNTGPLAVRKKKPS